MAPESLVLALLLGVIGTCLGQKRPPVFTSNMNGLQISESTEVGTEVYRLSATGVEPIEYDMKADMLIVNSTTGVVTLTRTVDYELGEKKFTVRVSAIDGDGLVETVWPTIEVVDANDNAPYFLRDTYRQTIPEDFSIGTDVISNLRAEDKDFKGGLIVVTCEPNATLANPNSTEITYAEYVEACNTFQPFVMETNNKNWLGRIKLLKGLDYETRSTYQLPLITTDGRMSRMQSFEIILSDVNDTPPRFSYVPENVPIQENIPIGTVIGSVTANDGDTTNPRPIRYNVTRCPTDSSSRNDAEDMFTVNFINGSISTKTNIDRESASVIRGLKLCIKAQEVIDITTTPIEIGDNNETTAVALIRIDVQDLNDQTPSFSNANYNTSIYEDIPNGTAVPGIALTITDLDGYPANSYDVRLVNFQDVFAVFPVNGSGRNIGGIKVIDTSKIDYESGNRLFELRIIAYENKFAEGGFQPNTGSTKVSIHVLDVNDNTPRFSQIVYNTSVMENDVGYFPIISYIQASDPDSGSMGTTGIIYRLLGSESERFKIEPLGGSVQVRVSPCDTPGQGDCINYERRRRYDFTIVATDENESPLGRRGTAQLVIHVIDVNDVAPVFTLNSYVGDIKEGERLLVNEVRVKAEDTDSVGTITYTLATSPGSQYWNIHPVTGLVTATEAIFRRFTPGDQGWFQLIVLANDTVNRVQTDVRINVIDQNNFAPRFILPMYYTAIPEETRGGFFVVRVEATDQDSSRSVNGRVEYSIEEGAQDKFVMDNGSIHTSTNAAFDYDIQNQYMLRVLARDGGNPQKTGTISVTISIIDENNKLPYFTSLVQFAEISENAQKGEYVTTILAKDPDKDAKLNFSLVEEIKAISPDGLNVDPNVYYFKDLFQLDSTSGVVRVNATRLDRDLTSVITYTMTVTDVSQTGRPQTGTPGILIIRIREYNDQSPAFLQSRYDLVVEEEQSIGTFITALVAQDADDAIARYDIVEREQNLFSIISETGVLTVRNRIDYERIEQTQFTVRAFDSGVPQRSGTAQVFVTIVNTNDNSPIPSQNTYQVNVAENATGGTSLLQVFARDIDKGDYGNVRFELPKDITRFTIDPFSGVMSMAPGVRLDREVEPIIATRVNVYDSPNDETVRRRYSVPVYVSVLDINDNYPVFSSNEYLSAEIIESIDIGAPIFQVFATDRDFGLNAQIVFRKVAGSGDPDGLFGVRPQSGQILVERSLRGRIGVHTFNVSATDRNGGPDGLKGYSRIVITVVESLNSAPVWIIPANDNMTIEVLESQYLGLLVFDAHADDNNSGRNGIVEYYFQDGSAIVSNTGEFSINRVTGVIRAEIVYDRETVDRYTLHLIAKDMGVVSLRSERHLYVKIADVNDNVPEFPSRNGKTIPMNILLWENTTVGAAIGQVRATDRDMELHTTIYYYVVAGGDGKFVVDQNTGFIRLSQAVDREIKSIYSFDIRATNDNIDYLLLTNRVAIDTSIITVRVTLRDVNDNAPVFVGFNSLDETNKHYFGFISMYAPFDQRIFQVTATDADAAGSAAITYSIISGNEDGFFAVDVIGRVANRRLLTNVIIRIYSLTIQAFDGQIASTAPAFVFVTNAGNHVKMVINLQTSEVEIFRSQIISLLMSLPGISHAGIVSITNHMGGQVVDARRSDVTVVAAAAVPTGGYTLLSTSQLLLILQEKRRASVAVFDSIYVESIGPAGAAPTWLDRTPVLAVAIIVILLLLMALLLLLFCCCCIKSYEKKPLAPATYLIPEKDEKKINPVYDNSISIVETTDAKTVIQTEDIYAVVDKTRSAHKITVSQDPYPFVDDDSPVIETEVVRGRAIGSSEVTIQVGPDVNDGPLPVIEALINEKSDSVEFSAALASESHTSSSQVVHGGEIDTYFFTSQPEADTESGSKYPYPSVQPTLEPLAEHSEQEESQDEETDFINVEMNGAQDRGQNVRIHTDAYTHVEGAVTYEREEIHEVEVEGGYPEGSGQRGSLASSGSVGTPGFWAGGAYEIDIHGEDSDSVVGAFPSTGAPTYEVEVEDDQSTVDKRGSRGGVNYEIEIHGGRPKSPVDVAPSTSGPTYEVEVEDDQPTADHRGSRGGVNYEIEIHGGRPKSPVDVAPATSGPTYEVEVEDDQPSVDQRGSGGGVNYEIEIHGGRPKGPVDVAPSTSGPYEVEVEDDQSTVDQRGTNGGVNYEIEIHGGNGDVHIDQAATGHDYEVEFQPNSAAAFGESYSSNTVGDGSYYVEIQDGHPGTSEDILPATSAPIYDVDIQGDFPIISTESDRSALVPSTGDRSYGVDVPGGGAVAPTGHVISETEKSMHSTSAAHSSRVISSSSPQHGGNVTVAETHSGFHTASAESRTRVLSSGDDDGNYARLRDVDDGNMALEFTETQNVPSPSSPHDYVYLFGDDV
ncbi:cadherin-87A-like isoform X3 [Haliotis rubra]|uniref:cadherin-87A-like isoform X2 n=1 Tax=Haliotis rubra TaxID=36100 RepID=UPI001EE5AC6F|nr:cadherin-87A-like isoform X2 [Haliotis rubra]XP_046569689.1 cadherin-87A-like isoform X3 [Haliotis rubra]